MRKKPWTGVKEAGSFGPDCINAPMFDTINGIAAVPMSEECLYLNVWAPANASAADKLPVMLWIHGGSFTSGGTTMYDGDSIFSYRSDFVLVTANYRLGAFGWLGGPAVQRSSTATLTFKLVVDDRASSGAIKVVGVSPTRSVSPHMMHGPNVNKLDQVAIVGDWGRAKLPRC